MTQDDVVDEPGYEYRNGYVKGMADAKKEHAMFLAVVALIGRMLHDWSSSPPTAAAVKNFSIDLQAALLIDDESALRGGG